MRNTILLLLCLSLSNYSISQPFYPTLVRIPSGDTVVQISRDQMDNVIWLEQNFRNQRDLTDSFRVIIDSCDTAIYLYSHQVFNLKKEIEVIDMQLAETESVVTTSQEVIKQQGKEIKKQRKLKTLFGSIGVIVTLILLGKVL